MNAYGFPKEQQRLLDFSHLNLPSSPNYCYVASKATGKRIIAAPIYNLTKLELIDLWKQMMTQQPRVNLLKKKDDQYLYVQRSLIFRFPDLVNIQFKAVSEQKSTVQILSRSVYGYYDFGVNCHRLEKWLKKMKHYE